jgi:hypothetical protein
MNAIHKLAKRLSSTTPRERAGLALLAALAASMAAISLFDWALVSRSRAESAASQLADMEAANARVAERDFQQNVGLAVSKVRDWSLVELSVGVAQAQGVAQLEALATSAGLTEVNVVAGEVVEPEPGGVGALSFELRARFDWSGFVAMLRAIEASETSVTVDAINVEADESLNLRLTAAYLREGPE